MSLGSKIQQIRKEHGLSQEQFADQFHVTRQTVSNWENDRNYPDMTSLRQISETFGISFDTLLKEDEVYLQRVDDSVKKVPVLKRLLLALLVIFLVAVAAFAALLHNAFQATEDGARINSDTLVRMIVNLRDSSPSRAITYTAESEKAKTEAYKKAVLGKIEGDIPMVSLQTDPAVVLHFQDYDYQDIRPELVRSVRGEFRDGTSDDPAWIRDDLAYEQEGSDIKVALDSCNGSSSREVIMKMGILACGPMAETFARTLIQMEEAECYAVASRSLSRAEAFAREYGFTKAYGSYEALCEDPEVELVYIATPHSCHYENMELCIRHKKPVLCEKAFTINAGEARKIMELAEQEQVFAAEAIWTRYMPSRQMIREVVDSGIIGKVSVLTANLSYPISGKERIMRPELAGGALLDIGVYGLNFALMHFGTDIERMESSVRMTDTGVDAMESITLFFRDGRMAVLTHDIYSRSDRKGIFYGEKGYIVVENINNPRSIAVYDAEDRLLKQTDVPEQISGYEYEVRECIEAIRAGAKESSSMPLSDSALVMEIMDRLRKQWGMVYPRER